ncbi:hypothetical protein HID58_003353 [Brassica napus]|uniref:Pectinesterase catalytic domain-containing protein n=1 Tax=Brassica napus TaxID=3708 RepID=A0ABQ8ESZ4_BRANA|nr:hypothetical protein HID58_003353 [Brassica napus]
METELGSLIDPKERIAWNSSVEPSPPTVNFDEYQNYGSGRLEYPKSTTAATATFYNKFVNTAGPEKFQAVAFHSKSNHSTLFRCAFYGYQDTLYVHVGEQLYKGYDIIGTMDFIFGNAAAVFQMCTTVIAAESAKDQKDKFGFSILTSKLLAYTGEEFTMVVYLGRWIAWNNSADSPPPTVNFNEYQNYELQLRLLHD